MEVHAAHGAVVLFELLKQSSHSVVENLHGAVVERGGNPRALRVKGEALDAVAFGFEFDEERVVLSHGRVRHDGGGKRMGGEGEGGRTQVYVYCRSF